MTVRLFNAYFRSALQFKTRLEYLKEVEIILKNDLVLMIDDDIVSKSVRLDVEGNDLY